MRLSQSLLAAAAVGLLAIAPVSAANNTANYGQVISSIQNTKKGMADVQAMTSVSSVNVVKISDIADTGNKASLDQALTKNDADITSLRSALTANTSVKTALAQQNVDVNAVVATDVSKDGVLTVYVR